MKLYKATFDLMLTAKEPKINIEDHEAHYDEMVMCWIGNLGAIIPNIPNIKEYPDRIIVWADSKKEAEDIVKEKLRNWIHNLSIALGLKEKKACIACNGSGYYDSLDSEGNVMICGSCGGTGIDKDDD